LKTSSFKSFGGSQNHDALMTGLHSIYEKQRLGTGVRSSIILPKKAIG